MSFFKNIVSDLSELGSNKNSFKKKFTSLFKLLSDYSFGDLQYSDDLNRQKISVAFNELVEYSQVVNKNEIIKIYFRDEIVDLSISTAIEVSNIWTKDILDNNIQLTNSYAKRIIDNVKTGARIDALSFSNTKSLIVEFPNFAIVSSALSDSVKGLITSQNTHQQIEYKYPILTYGRIMGNIHFGILKNTSDYTLYYNVMGQMSNKKIEAKSIKISNDLLKEEYYIELGKMMDELQSNPLFLDISVNG